MKICLATSVENVSDCCVPGQISLKVFSVGLFLRRQSETTKIIDAPKVLQDHP
jgi:hypothetical protein